MEMRNENRRYPCLNAAGNVFHDMLTGEHIYYNQVSLISRDVKCGSVYRKRTAFGRQP